MNLKLDESGQAERLWDWNSISLSLASSRFERPTWAFKLMLTPLPEQAHARPFQLRDGKTWKRRINHSVNHLQAKQSKKREDCTKIFSRLRSLSLFIRPLSGGSDNCVDFSEHTNNCLTLQVNLQSFPRFLFFPSLHFHVFPNGKFLRHAIYSHF